MREVLVRATRNISADCACVGCIGEDVNGVSWAWVVPESCRPPTDEWVEMVEDQLLPCPRDVRRELLPTLVGYWPAWQITEWARLEFGCGVLIVGSGMLAKQVAQLCRCRGVLWRAVWSEARFDGAAEYWIPWRPGHRSDEVVRILPARPDKAIVLGGAPDEIFAALRICRDGGTVVIVGHRAQKVDLNLYPDVHWRGLRVQFGASCGCGGGDAEAWHRAVRRMNTLVELGLLVACAE